MHRADFSKHLLAWYDANARKMAWRIGPKERAAGQLPDPYRVWLSEIMLQQTTVATVRDYFIGFTDRWPGVADLAGAADAEVMAQWAGLGYYARARNLLKCARLVVADHGGAFPADYDALIGLPGIGPYTAGAISAIAFDLPETVVDGNVQRVMARYYAVREPLKRAKKPLSEYARRLTPHIRPGDYAQAVMDLGATVCTPKNPDCAVCPVSATCRARAQDLTAVLPAKAAKTPKPTRLGMVYVARRADGAWLLERRPPRGLLGGMLGWPGSDWGDNPAPAPPISGNWRASNTLIKHTFTHFHLHLTLHTLSLPQAAKPDTGFFQPAAEFDPANLPTLMKKAHNAAALHFKRIEKHQTGR